MKCFQNHKKALITCLLIGFFIAMLTRSSFLVFTTDFSYFRINDKEYPAQAEFDSTNNGKQVIGLSGFPFRTFSNCVMGFHGTVSRPACNHVSLIWEFSIIFNTVFWGAVCYGAYLVVLKIAKVKFKKQNTL